MGVLQLLARENYITYNKALARRVGLEAAIVFGELCSKSNLYGDSEFWCLKENIESDTCLSGRAVRLAIQTLQKTGLVSVVKKGIPCKNYYTLHEGVLIDILSSDSKSDTSSGHPKNCKNEDSTGLSGVENDVYSGVKIDTTGDCKNDTAGDIKSDTTFIKNKDKKLKEKINSNAFAKYPIEAGYMANLLLGECQKIDSKFNRTEKQLGVWASDFDKLNRIDGRDWDEIKCVLLWAKSDNFWSANILSAGKFREKYPTLIAQMQRGRNGKPFMANDVYTGEDW